MTEQKNAENSPVTERVLTRTDFVHMAAGIHAGKDWGAWTAAEQALYLARMELVRLVCVAEYSTSPLYQARAAKDPDYWNSFSMGRFNLHPKMEARLMSCFHELTQATGTATTEGLLQAFQESEPSRPSPAP
jgi:hypothetical protein